MKITFVRPKLQPHRAHVAMQRLCFATLKRPTPPDVETVPRDTIHPRKPGPLHGQGASKP